MNDARDIKVDLQPGRYVVAVSGGVDSIALLHMIKDIPDVELIVAHVNHGIRPKEHGDKDTELIAGLCKKWRLTFRSKDLHLGPDASEEKARNQRLHFLLTVKRENNYNQIITAHHKDDVIETMIINLLRGTGRLGLSSMKSSFLYLRPLLDFSKQDILAYADKNNLIWNEDITNEDTGYLRNNIRLNLLPKMEAKNPNVKDEFFAIYKRMLKLNDKIDSELSSVKVYCWANRDEMVEEKYDRNKFIMLPLEVGYETTHYILSHYGIEASKQLIKRVRNFIHTAKPGRTMNITKHSNLICQAKTFTIVPTETESSYPS